MSVCIASMADNRQSIVLATDQMISVGPAVTLDNTMVKIDFISQPGKLGPFWAVMWAGNDITAIPPILQRAKDDLKKDGPGSEELKPAQVADALSRAYQIEMRARISADILSQYDMDFGSFATTGPAFFGDHFGVILQRIEQYQLGVELLVAGFGEHGFGTLFTVGEHGVIRYYDKVGFWVIGSGDQLALSALALRGHNREKTIDRAVYAVCEAKFCAELAMGVGRHTTVVVLDKQRLLTTIPTEYIDRVRQIWEQHGRPPIPTSALIAIGEGLKEQEPLLSFTTANSQAPRRSKRDRKVRPPSPE